MRDEEHRRALRRLHDSAVGDGYLPELLSVQRCQHPPQAERSCWGGGPDPPSSRALLLGGSGGSAMSLVVQGGYRAECGRSMI